MYKRKKQRVLDACLYRGTQRKVFSDYRFKKRYWKHKREKDFNKGDPEGFSFFFFPQLNQNRVSDVTFKLQKDDRGVRSKGKAGMFYFVPHSFPQSA